MAPLAAPVAPAALVLLVVLAVVAALAVLLARLVLRRFKRVTFAFLDHLVDLFISRCQFAWLLRLLRNSTAWRACVAMV